MANRLPPLSALRAFEAAARLQSFKKAAEELSVTATAISHRIRVLESELGRPLFVRRVRAVDLTPDGQILFAAVRAGFDTISAAVEQVRKPPRTSVTISTTPAFATKWLIPRMTRFQAEHPDIDLRVHASNTPVDLQTGTADLAIRYGSGNDEGAIATLLLEDAFAPVASPSLNVPQGGDPAQWPLIHFDWHRKLPVDLTWAAWAKAAGRKPSAFSAGIRYSEESHAIQAAVAGHGVALLSVLLVEQELRQELLRVVAQPVLKGMAYRVLKSDRRPVSSAVAAVGAWLVEASRRSD